MGRAVSERPRAVIVKLKTFKVTQECLNRSPRLKGTNIYINEDISKATHEIMKTLDEGNEGKTPTKINCVFFLSGIDYNGTRTVCAQHREDRQQSMGGEKDGERQGWQQLIPGSNKGTAPSYGEKLRERK